MTANANAQEAQVYEPSSGMWNVTGTSTDVNAENTIKDIIAAINALVAGNPGHGYFALLEGGVTMFSQRTTGGLPDYSPDSTNPARPPRLGDILAFTDGGISYTVTVRVYAREPGGELYMAFGEELATLAATVSSPQFFIDTANWRATEELRHTNVGAVNVPIPGGNGGGDSKARDFAYLGAGVFAVGAAAVFLSGGDFSLFDFASDYGYSFTESGYAYNYGGRLNFAKDNWRLYWTAGQTNANGDFGEFRYASGGEYRTDFWTAAFSESVQGETAEYDFSLSANFRNGIWKVSPEFAVDSRYENGEFTTTNSFRFTGDLQYDDWRFSVNGDTERMQLFAEHRF